MYNSCGLVSVLFYLFCNVYKTQWPLSGLLLYNHSCYIEDISAMIRYCTKYCLAQQCQIRSGKLWPIDDYGSMCNDWNSGIGHAAFLGFVRNGKVLSDRYEPEQNEVELVCDRFENLRGVLDQIARLLFGYSWFTWCWLTLVRILFFFFFFCHASETALVMADLVKLIKWIELEFDTDICVPLKGNCNNLINLIKFSVITDICDKPWQVRELRHAICMTVNHMEIRQCVSCVRGSTLRVSVASSSSCFAKDISWVGGILSSSLVIGSLRIHFNAWNKQGLSFVLCVPQWSPMFLKM